MVHILQRATYFGWHPKRWLPCKSEQRLVRQLVEHAANLSARPRMQNTHRVMSLSGSCSCTVSAPEG